MDPGSFGTLTAPHRVPRTVRILADLDPDWTVEAMNPVNFPAFFGESRRILALASTAIIFTSLVVIAYLTGGLLSAFLCSVVIALVVRLLWAAATFRPMHCGCPPHPGNPCCRAEGHGPHGEYGPHQNGPHQNGPHQNGPHGEYGPHQNGPHQNGPHQNGPHQNGPHQNGSHQNGSQQDVPEQNGQRRDGNRSDVNRSHNVGNNRQPEASRNDRPRHDRNRPGDGRSEPASHPADGAKEQPVAPAPRADSPVIDPWRGGFAT